jgi:hypothetical protein
MTSQNNNLSFCITLYTVENSSVGWTGLYRVQLFIAVWNGITEGKNGLRRVEHRVELYYVA